MIQNPILRGFCPDPSIIRAGEDFYIATSTFEWWPGVRLFHSKDLKNWEQIPSPLRRVSQLNMVGDPASGGVWAPCLSYDGKKFWLIFTDVKTKKGRYYNTHNYLVYADDIRGVWSDPVYLNSVGFDPSLFHDVDGRKYLINMLNGFKGITVQEYDPLTNRLVGRVEKVFGGTEAGFTEGPHMYHIGDWYYLLVAEGGTSYGHQVTIARSRSIWGPFEVDPENPMLTSAIEDENALQKAGHADFVDTGHGEWYMVHLCGRSRTTEDGRKVCLTGRETAIQKVCWKDGWLRLESGGRFAQTETEEPEGIPIHPLPEVPARDDFNENMMGLRYSCPRAPLVDSMNQVERPGWLRLYGQESLNSLHHVSLMGVRQEELHAMAETAMDFVPERPEQAAGLAYMYDAMNFYIFIKTRDEAGKTVLNLICSDSGVCTDLMEPVEVPETDVLYLRAQTDEAGAFVRFFYSMDGTGWIQAGGEYTTEILTDEHCRGFTGAHFGMYCHDMSGSRKFADFDYFTYKNI